MPRNSSVKINIYKKNTIKSFYSILNNYLHFQTIAQANEPSIMQLTQLATLLLASASLVKCTAAPENIFVADYTGKVHTVQFTPLNAAENTTAKMTLLHTSNSVGPKPSWLFKGLNKERLWYSSENVDGESGWLSRHSIAADGSLQPIGIRMIPGAPVQASFAFNNSGLFMAQYGGVTGTGTGGGVAFIKAENGEMSETNTKTYVFPNLTTPGLAPQDLPRAHGVATDPSGRFVVVPDLGADKLRVFGLEGSDASYLSWRTDLEVQLPQGTGPRHATFFRHTPSDTTPLQWYLFVVNEIKNTIMTFNATYVTVNGTVSLNLSGPSREISTLAGVESKVGMIQNTKAAEIEIAPCNRFLTVSNRNVTSPDFQGYADGLATFEINADGSLVPVDYRVLGLAYPRGFDFHPSGDKVLVASQLNSTVAVYPRDTQTGKIGKLMTLIAFNTDLPDGTAAGIPHAIWDYR